MKPVEGFWSKTGACVQTVVGSILLLGLRWRTLVASSMDRRPPPSLSEHSRAADGFSHVASEMAAGCRPLLEELHPRWVPPSALCSDSSSQLECTPSVARNEAAVKLGHIFCFIFPRVKLISHTWVSKSREEYLKAPSSPLHVRGGKKHLMGADWETGARVVMSSYVSKKIIVRWNNQFWIVNLISLH